MNLNGLMDLHLHIRTGIKENLIMQTKTKIVSQWDGDIPMNKDCDGLIFHAITGSHYTSAKQQQVR